MSKMYDTIIIGGSYAGLSAAMALGRALRNVLIIDEGKPCNIRTPQSHNFITQDAKPPLVIKEEAMQQVLKYETVTIKNGSVTSIVNLGINGFKAIDNKNGEYLAKKVLFTTGVKDIMPNIKGFKESWGKTVIHCPYCHGYEVRNKETGILANGEIAFEFAKLISNWTNKLTIYTSGASTLSINEKRILADKNISIESLKIEEIAHNNGVISELKLVDGSNRKIEALYARPFTEQHCEIPKILGCELSESKHIVVDSFQKTSIKGIYAAGDCTSMFRSVALAVSSGSVAGAAINHELIDEEF